MVQKKWWLALVLSIFLGGLGVDRFYLGYIKLGILKILSILICIGIVWWIADIILIASGRLKDAQGFELARG